MARTVGEILVKPHLGPICVRGERLVGGAKSAKINYRETIRGVGWRNQTRQSTVTDTNVQFWFVGEGVRE